MISNLRRTFRMKQFLYGSLSLLFIFVLAGCDLVTNSTTPNQPQVGNDLMITEVFTISPDRYYAYSWIEVYNPTNRSIHWSDVTRPAHGIIVGGSGAIFETPEDGRVWNSRTANTNATIRGLAFEFPDTGLAVCEGGTVLKSTHKEGEDWSPWNVYPIVFRDAAAPPLNVNLNAIEAPSVTVIPGQKQAWLVGDNGTIVHSVDKAQTWEYQNSKTTQNINTVFSKASPTYLLAAADSGVVIMTTNGGIAWTRQDVSRKVNLYGLSLLSAATSPNDSIWVCGEQGLIFHSFTASKAAPYWILETTPVTTTLRAIYFPIIPPVSGASSEFNGSGNGWAVGDNGTIIHTSDYGNSWVKQTSPSAQRLNAVRFVDSLHGFILGDAGTILYTSNGGSSWLQQSSGTSQNLYGMYFYTLSRQVTNYYLLRMRAQRKFFYQDLTQLRFNYNYYTNIDTGDALYIPYLLESAADIEDNPINPGTFAVITSDSGAFNDHTKLGPGHTQIKKASLLQTVPLPPVHIFTGGGFIDLYLTDIKWTLMPAGEISFIKYHAEERDTTVIVQGVPVTYKYVARLDSTVIDVVRYGGYVPPGDKYPGDVAAPLIPEWSSLARYQDDYGFDDPTQFNTAYSFYITPDPIPGWGSQRRRNK
jgi:photosystem II stability/assembly factor-like uncharacterized protein